MEHARADDLRGAGQTGVVGGIELQQKLPPVSVDDLEPDRGPAILSLDDLQRKPGRDARRPGAIASGVSGRRWLRGRTRSSTARHPPHSRRGPGWPLERQRAIDLASQRVAHQQRRVDLAQPEGRGALATSAVSCSCQATGRSGSP
jgi:hypothetical protein